ncbi:MULTISPECIES: DNA glycosylase [unclassified Haladaptatus]|uniref:DNA-3-methyladenine glycosylase family protein n=1 Tax=unclassified Haladaptatus TaxID=2622732 RepID=UPI00209C4D39|nr:MULTISPECIES: DNA glycosylase [unclassified Haladaptatus]MCO8243856.1 8-oxoguanine DNA glycosylase [Haladaptatus sp. AB643]MCO8253470.1 8-oxoguanine DNA glycosylase [Haladaptatus sp. AB618]
METGSIPVEELPGGFDLQSTVESGQSYLWRREDGRMYETTHAYGGSAWYYTVLDGNVIRARQRDGLLEWEATTDAEPHLFSLLRLDDDLDAIIDATPADSLVESAYDEYRGMRIVRDPFFPCLVSFICSAQMRVSRIYGMQTALAREFGTPIEFDEKTYYEFPTPDALAEASEGELRDLNLGYRAPYVKKSAELLSSGEASPDDVRGKSYEDARDAMQAFVGVGDKVADCVLLFALDYLEAVPLDTWIQSAIEDHYPHCEQGSYKATSRAIREQFGEYAGYAQTYVFHYLRS